MSQVNPKVGGKYLIRDNYRTKGGRAFMKDMERWKKTPLTVDSLFEDADWIWVRGSRGDLWRVIIQDLLPYRIAKLENK